ncbi:MAG: peptidoglycan bridge formation glycyltransferase FemA/FemB family protein [Treponema sp.]|jgi:lipid II:glycine glycyltransferase (peptidoglycan interpeptide bridge formation enzyme)|nr:peptidoglycan bridge formation glycyltransferase FemA/FemB family protein [Treponema sp.]
MDTFLYALRPAALDFCEGASFLQSAFWGRFKARFGWEAHAFSVEWAGAPAENPPSPLLALTRPLVRGVGFAYIPWGPELPATLAAPAQCPGSGASGLSAVRTRALVELARELRPHLPRNTAFVRFDPPWYNADGQSVPLLERPLSRAAMDVQPASTVLISLDQDDEALLAAMKEKCRYNIRLSARKGVAVRRCNETELDVFYRLFEETAKRDGIAIHSRDYYAALFALAKEAGCGIPVDIRLYIAAHEGEDLAAIITLFRGDEAVYLYGASSNRKRNLMAPYLLQWTAIRDARASGCKRYDLFGIPPANDPAHPMAGLYRFKTGFGGRIVHRSGSWDFACRPFARNLFALAETLRKNFRARKKNKNHRKQN